MHPFRPNRQLSDYKRQYSNSRQKDSSSEYLDVKPVPKGTEIEEAVLGAILLESGAIGDVADVLKPKDFFLEKHQVIYKAAIELFSLSQPIDTQTIIYQLEKNGDLSKAGDKVYITKLTNKVISSANIETHAHFIRELSLRRELIKYSAELDDLAYDATVDVIDLLERAESQLFQISETKSAVESFETIVHASVNDIGDAKDKKNNILLGVPSGFNDLDSIILGWQKSDLIIIAARPSMGKTAFILSALRNAVVNYGKKVAVFSLEMSAKQMAQRMIAAEANVEATKLRTGSLSTEEWDKIHEKANMLGTKPIFINDNAALTIFELRSECRRLKKKHGLDFIVIDYLQLMQGFADAKHFNREQEISYISRSLKALAKELDVPVVALSQLSRAVESRQDKRPIISDLRESGSIEQDADLVLLLFRPEYYGVTTNDKGEDLTGLAEIIVAKHRNGPVGSAMLRFLSEYVRFDDKDALINLPSKVNDMSAPDSAW